MHPIVAISLKLMTNALKENVLLQPSYDPNLPRLAHQRLNRFHEEQLLIREVVGGKDKYPVRQTITTELCSYLD